MSDTVKATHRTLAPALRRFVVERLLSWLPPGTVRLSGDIDGVRDALLGAGVSIQVEGESASAVVAIADEQDEHSALASIPRWLDGRRVPVCVIILGQGLDSSRRVFWEKVWIAAGWRKHPLVEMVAPYGELDTLTGPLMLAFEPVPPEASERYPLEALVAERDLHTDMTREAGRRSDAHMTRYAHASQFIKDGDRVIDVACGLGYGTYQLARMTRASSLLGIDASDYAASYAKVNFPAPPHAALHFSVGDAQELGSLADRSVDFAVSVETLEHLPEPDLLLSELHRVLAPGGRVYASVPNDWSDDTGEDPNPFHFHVYDWPRLYAQFQRNGFTIEKAWLQDAGGGQKRHLALRSMLEIDPLTRPSSDGEWLLVLARRSDDVERGGEDDALAMSRSLLLSGQAEAAIASLEELVADRSLPLTPGLASALLAIVHARAGRQDRAATAWTNCADFLRPSLDDVQLRPIASSVIALAYAALSNPEKPVHSLLLNHAEAASCLRLPSSVSHYDDLRDRSVLVGDTADEPLNMTASAVRSTVEAKIWLAEKYAEHTSRIAELESYTAELEIARRWLDGQFHELTEQVKQLRKASS
jgi:SAM-dependent methyltransferase